MTFPPVAKLTPGSYVCPRKLSRQEFELQEQDQWLSAADAKVVLATKQIRVYK